MALATLCATIVASGCGQGPKGLSGSAYDASVRAISALERADEHKHDSEMAFASFLTDYQKAVDEVGIAGGRDGWRSADHEAWSQLRKCSTVLDSYRLIQSGIAIELQILELKHLPVELSGKDRTRAADATFELNKCIMEAKAFE